MKNLITKVNSILLLLDRKSLVVFYFSALVGFFWFAIESSFVFILQVYFHALGLVPSSMKIPQFLDINFDILTCSLILVVFGFVRALTFYFKFKLSMKLQQSSYLHFRSLIVDKIENLELFKSSQAMVLAFFGEKTNNVGLFFQYLSLSVVNFISGFLFLIFGLYYSYKEMLLCTLLLFLFLVPFKFLTKRIHKLGVENNAIWEQSMDLLNSVLKNHFLIQIYKLFFIENNKIKSELKKYETHYDEYSRYLAFLTAYPLFVGIFVLACVSYISIYVFKSPGLILVSFFYVFMRFVNSVSEINQYYSVIKANYPAVIDFLNFKNIFLNNEQAQHKENLEIIKNINSIQISNVTFSYQKNKNILSSIDIQLNKKDIFLIKGPSGSGKSTFLKILLGLINPDHGEVLYNNINLAKLDNQWRNLIGYVGPESFMINGTIRENLNYLQMSEASDEQLIHVLKLVSLYDELYSHQLTLDTKLTDQNILSTGQKQRLAMARTLLRNPEVLILDEATANLDRVSELKIINTLQEVSSAKIIIVVSHKDSFDALSTKALNLSGS